MQLPYKSFFLHLCKMEVDYIVVGFGLAGMAFVNTLEENKQSFVVYEDASQTSSHVAGGVYNPVVLKRFTPVWNGTDQLKVALPFYKKLEQRFQSNYDHAFDTYRIFKSAEEQNNWFSASDKPLLSTYMDTNIVYDTYAGIIAENGYGRLKHTGRIDTKRLMDDYKKDLEQKGLIRYESFAYDALELKDNQVAYKDVSAKKVVFCEGYGMHKNPFFNYLPLNGTKGEMLTIHAPDLQIDFLVKAAVFVLPLGNDLYKVGATFNWSDKTSETTEKGKQELVEKLNSFINCPYTIVSQSAGIRPTVTDRRPLLGLHPEYRQLALINGLGTRGVMIAPTVASQMYDAITNGKALDKEVDIARFTA